MLKLVLPMLLLATIAQAQPAPGLRLTVTGPPEPALVTPAQCMPPDMPDAPARAIRLADGRVLLYATDQINRANAGLDLRHLRHECPVIYQGSHTDDPAAWDDRSWITSLWTEDGTTIDAILHNEFHGQLRPALCPSGRYMDCWYNSLTLAVSHDSGASFQRAAPALVAALPYRFDQLPLGHHGYFNPTNIVRNGSFLYMLAFTTEAGAQQPGSCLLRTDNPARADSWRTWDGTGFTRNFIDPYRSNATAADHVCVSVGRGSLRWPVTSLVRQQGTSLFLALMQDTSPTGAIYYATSPDLVHWSAPAHLMTAPGLTGWRCTLPEPLAYPSLLDPDSADRNFSIVGVSALLFATRFERSDCRSFRDRTLVRWPITIERTPD